MHWTTRRQSTFTAVVLRIMAWAAVASLHAPMALAAGGMYPVDPGEQPELGASEGFLLVVVDSEIQLDGVYMRKDGAMLNSGVLRRTPRGRNLQLMRVPAGTYVWDTVRTPSGMAYKLKDNPEFRFEVRPGQIVYAGDLSFRSVGFNNAYIHTTNRGLAAMDWLESAHPDLYRRYPFAFSGHYADPFPAFYRKAQAAAGDAGKRRPALAPPPDPGPLPLPVETLWRAERLQGVSLSPAGKLLAIYRVDADGKHWTIDMLDLDANETQQIVRSELPFEVMQWSGDETLLLSFVEPAVGPRVAVVHIDSDAAGRHRYRQLGFKRVGRVLDPLAEDPSHILFASTAKNGSLLVHKLDVSSQSALDRFRADPADRLNLGLKDERWWFADGAGQLSVAVVIRDGESVLMNRRGNRFAEFFRVSAGAGFSPSALSYDGKSLIGLSGEDRDQRELVEFDIASRRISRTLFSKPGIDIVSPLFNARNDAIGVRYYQGGRLVNEYFDRQDRERAARVAAAFPGRSVSVIEQNLDGSRLILMVDAADETPKVYQLDMATRRAVLIEDTLPWLGSYRFAPTSLITALGKDGLPIEAFLTLPAADGLRPLVVMPHGGPVGVSDHLHFDRDVQFLASLGFAVLRVNFRGSGGYGEAFREAGYGQFGTLIEDDIDAALAEALERYPIDPARMCTLGFSYGGYSALIAVARAPERYRCAISVSGISDRLLFFTASDSARTADGRKVLEKIVGDPATQQAKMVETSPLYRYRDINVPVMLAHGRLDPRVDIEHERRMRRMLELAGNPPVGLIFDDSGHTIEGMANTERLWSGIAGFLRRYLVRHEATAAGQAGPDPAL